MSIFIIAEAGVNHNGSLRAAKRLIDAAAGSGADAVKFQTFHPEQVVIEKAEKAAYQKKTTGEQGSQLEMIKKLALDSKSHHVLFRYCQRRKIEFMSTPFDLDSIDLLLTLNVRRLKISSGDVTNAPLLYKAACTKLPIILSTGMSEICEIRDALGVIAFGYLGLRCKKPDRALFRKVFASNACRLHLQRKVTLLQCTSEYPTPPCDVNLRAMDTLRKEFNLPVGLSDHTVGIHVAIAAAARNATVIEKHLTLDRSLSGPDHKASLEPDEFRRMVACIRDVENALGSSIKTVASSERKNKLVARRALVAAHSIRRGEVFTENNIIAKRPGRGISPLNYWHFLGLKAHKDFEKDEALTLRRL
jgi:N-acetylneuraminate synthase